MAKKRQKVGGKGGKNAYFGAKDETDAKAMKPATKGRCGREGVVGAILVERRQAVSWVSRVSQVCFSVRLLYIYYSNSN